ncbi:hypothetical protein BIW11_02376 [Tropilaelaps mercedesae]|uniref:Uncharacterized protein n=1 Tax=Tropilaelaps mercedesae TaxID=418985 RepID=A0A1V9WYH2_9ACAR|nr:hypothetical protein BIW11_02376 [Tropilaelaps mercedesae]
MAAAKDDNIADEIPPAATSLKCHPTQDSPPAVDDISHKRRSSVTRERRTRKRRDAEGLNVKTYKNVGIDCSLESVSDPPRKVCARSTRQAWCFDASLQQAGFYIDGYGIIPDPTTVAEKIRKPTPLPRSCALESASPTLRRRFRQTLRGGNVWSEALSSTTERSVEASKTRSSFKPTSSNHKLKCLVLQSGVLIAFALVFFAGYCMGAYVQRKSQAYTQTV